MGLPKSAEADGAHALSPDEWTKRLSAGPVLDSRAIGWATAQIQMFRGIAPVSYPRLDHHCLTLHLGQPRHISRRGEGRALAVDVRPGALSFTPSGAEFEWRTTGPVDYAELYVSPKTIEAFWGEVPDVPHSTLLQDRLGAVEPLVEALFKAMLDELGRGDDASCLHLDTLFASLWLRLGRLCGDGGSSERTDARGALSPSRLRRVLNYVEQHLGSEIAVGDLAAVAGLSAYHFSRAFTAMVGSAPYAYVLSRRIAHAQRLLSGPMSIPEAAAACGFRTEGQFSRMFKSSTGVTPRRFRAAADCGRFPLDP